MSFDREHRKEQERRFSVEVKVRTSLMSNAKWRKVLCAVQPIIKAVSPYGEQVAPSISYKLLRDSTIRKAGIWPANGDVLDTYIRDGVWGCPIEYKEIEWVEIPGTYQINPNSISAQNTGEIYDAIEGLGKYPVENIANGIRIWGYK